MKTFTFAAFIVVALVQWYVPLSMVRESEVTVSDGDELLFLTEPEDPSDPFRGKYITLTFAEENQYLDTIPQYYADQEVFASFTIDSAGFADLVSLYEIDPGDAAPWVFKTKVTNAYTYDDSVQWVQLKFPFDRFYLEESKASDAETAYRESMLFADSTERSYAVVKIKDGRAVLTDVRIGEKSIVQIVKERNEQKDF
jgi:uncharacterized membrane-anchored protein